MAALSHRPRPPLTLWGYVLGALWKLILLTTSVLVTVLAFAAAVKLLADGKLGPYDTILFMGYAIPPMLQYALPFAAGFGATLGYHRLAADNEVTASQAGGISYRSLLGPGLLTGLALTAALIALSNHVIPTLLRKMQELAMQDVPRLMVSAISRGEAIDMGNRRRFLVADEVVPKGPDAAVGAYEVLYLRRVLVVQLDKAGDVESEGTADEAWVWFIRQEREADDAAAPTGDRENAPAGGGTTLIKLQLNQFVPHRRGEGRGEFEGGAFTYEIPTPLRDDPKFLSWRELREVRKKPEMMGPVNGLRRELATILAERATTEKLIQSLKADGAVTLADPAKSPVTLRGSGLEWSPERKWYRVIPPDGKDGPVRLDRTLGGGPGGGGGGGGASGKVQMHSARRAYIRSLPRAQSAGREIVFEIRLEEVSTTGASAEPSADRQPRDSVAGTRSDLTFTSLAPIGTQVEDLMGLDCKELLKRADERVAAFPWEAGPKDTVGPPRDSLRKRIDRLMREVVSKEHERMAMALSCLVMVLTGCVMAMRLKDSLPLTVYLWSFVPALASVLTIIGGQQMMHQHGLVAAPLLWCGVGGLGVFGVVEYLKLRKH